jgi:hypothetical protein
MSHFYRLLTRDNGRCSDRTFLDVVYMNDTTKSTLGSARPIPGEETQLTPPIPGMTLLSVSCVPQDQDRAYVVSSGKNDMPDILGWGEQIILSDKAKAVIQAFDDFPHQFYETQFLTDMPRARAIEGRYHVLLVRRVLKCTHPEEITKDIKRIYPYFFGAYEIGSLKTILDSAGIKNQVAQLPIWRLYGSSGGHYLSEGLVQALKEAGLTGLVGYTDDLKPDESIVRI